MERIGDHLRSRRLDLGLLQRQAADRIGVSKSTFMNWERGRAEPEFRFLPAVIRFLGYDPRRPAFDSIGQSLIRLRQGRGQSQAELAVELGVDPGTLARWERGERQPGKILFKRVWELLRGLL